MESFLSQFIVPERTKAGCSFADTPERISFEESKIVVYGVPLDATTGFGKGTARGPEAIRLASARQIETFVFDRNADIYDMCSIFDLGDVRIARTAGASKTLDYLNKTIPMITNNLQRLGKIPLLIGGEHTLTYYQLKELENQRPLVLHFDAHRDMKPEYEGVKLCHTTPFYHLLQHIGGKNIIQIGIRQTDRNENEIAQANGVTTFDAWKVHDNFASLASFLTQHTANRNIYISFDIDAYDLSYVPCTGTPEPYGLDPFQVLAIIDSIHPSAKLVGLDMVEVGLKNDDYREGTLATQTLFRILSHSWSNSLR